MTVVQRWMRTVLLVTLCAFAVQPGAGQQEQHARQLLEIPAYRRGPDYNYFLNFEQRERGLGYIGSRRRLKAVVNKLLDGEKIHVTTVGGSVTAGLHGVGDGHSWPDYLFNFLNDTFPGQLHSTNGAVPGTISSYMSACVNIHVPKTSDIVLVEYTVNDIHHVMPLFMNEYRRAYERLLRKLLAYPNRPAVILMHSYNWLSPPAGRFWTNLEREYTEFAWYYDLPSLSLKTSSYHAMIQGKEGFSIHQARHDDVEGLAGKSFYFDKIHPDALTGARAMAELAMHLVTLVRKEVEQQRAEGGGAQGGGEDAGDAAGEGEGASDIPPPMIPGNYETASDRCFIGNHFQETILSADGFEWLNDSRGRAPKYGYISTVPGSILKIKVNTKATSSAAAASAADKGKGRRGGEEEGDDAKADHGVEGEGEGEASGRRLHRAKSRTSHLADHVLVQLVHLKSYEGMGSASVTCELGCKCTESAIEGLDPTQHNSQLYLHSLYVSQSEECVIAIKVRPGPKGRTKVKVAGVIVSEEAGEIKGAAKTVEAVEMVHTIALQRGGSFDVRTKSVAGRPGALQTP